MNKAYNYHLIIIGSGGAGMLAAITATNLGYQVLLLEKLPKIGAKLKATGGGKCNLTNTLEPEAFMSDFGRNGRFMTQALNALSHQDLRDFFSSIGVESHSPDGFRVFPITHNADTILSALEKEMLRLGVTILCEHAVDTIYHERASLPLGYSGKVTGVGVNGNTFSAPNIIIATGGLGYPKLGSEGDGYKLANTLGHKTTPLFPAMMPLKTKEKWGANCRADTIAKATIRIDLPKAKKLKACGDLIFTKEGIRGPVVLDFAREITPLLEKHGEVPLLINLTKGMNEEDIRQHLKQQATTNPDLSIVEHVSTLLPNSLSQELCLLSDINPNDTYSTLCGILRDKLINILAWTPLTVDGHDGFKMAMITRGGISLKEINPNTMESKLIKGLYFCGEVMDLDGPCGGYNLQWSFASGYLAGHLGEDVS